MFDTLQDRLAATFRSLRGKGRLSEGDLNDALREIRLALLEADVNLSVVKEFIAGVRAQLSGAELSQALNPSRSSRSSTPSSSRSSAGRPARSASRRTPRP